MPTPSLLPIIAHARSGALAHAWRLFREAGLEGMMGDPAVLSLHGRLLKDEALAADGAARRRLYQAAAGSYRAAAEAGGGTYPLINAAALSLLAGDAEEARGRARAVLGRLETDADDTPYYLAATRAEALLLLGEARAAEDALAEAVRLAPQAWEDHASTLRQFGLILDAQGAEAAWLDRFRPPRVAHFAGHMAIAPEDTALGEQVAEILEAERVGFAYGALGAGSDLIIAEALLARGADLHVVLPARPDLFREASAAKFGGDWAQRFDACLAAASGLRWLEAEPSPPHDLDVRLASEIAMGLAVLQAGVLETEALQIVVLASETAGPGEGASAWAAAAWTAAGRRRRTVVRPRDPRPTHPLSPTDPTARLAALLEVEMAPADGDPVDDLAQLARIVAEGPETLARPRWLDRRLALAYATPSDAAAAAQAILAIGAEARPVAIGGHYGVVRRMADPFGGPAVLAGAAEATARELLASVPPGAAHVTEDFAAALYSGPRPRGLRAEYVGEAPGEDLDNLTRIYSLRRTGT